MPDIDETSEDDVRTSYTILGRTVGTATGWDQVDTNMVVLYDFEPGKYLKGLPSGAVVFDFECGYIVGEDNKQFDLITALSGLPRAP